MILPPNHKPSALRLGRIREYNRQLAGIARLRRLVSRLHSVSAAAAREHPDNHLVSTMAGSASELKAALAAFTPIRVSASASRAILPKTSLRTARDVQGAFYHVLHHIVRNKLTPIVGVCGLYEDHPTIELSGRAEIMALSRQIRGALPAIRRPLAFRVDLDSPAASLRRYVVRGPVRQR